MAVRCKTIKDLYDELKREHRHQWSDESFAYMKKGEHHVVLVGEMENDDPKTSMKPVIAQHVSNVLLPQMCIQRCHSTKNIMFLTNYPGTRHVLNEKCKLDNLLKNPPLLSNIVNKLVEWKQAGIKWKDVSSSDWELIENTMWGTIFFAELDIKSMDDLQRYVARVLNEYNTRVRGMPIERTEVEDFEDRKEGFIKLLNALEMISVYGLHKEIDKFQHESKSEVSLVIVQIPKPMMRKLFVILTLYGYNTDIMYEKDEQVRACLGDPLMTSFFIYKIMLAYDEEDIFKWTIRDGDELTASVRLFKLHVWPHIKNRVYIDPRDMLVAKTRLELPSDDLTYSRSEKNSYYDSYHSDDDEE
jgi:hypothetical protein